MLRHKKLQRSTMHFVRMENFTNCFVLRHLFSTAISIKLFTVGKRHIKSAE